MMLAPELCERGTETRRALSSDIQHNMPQEAVALLSDEYHFPLGGTVNKHNFRDWTENNTRFSCTSHAHTVWYAGADFGIWGSYFLEKKRSYNDSKL